MRKNYGALIVLLASTAYAEIAGPPGGSCTVAGASATCTFNVAAPTGSLILTFGHRTGSTTAPGNPTSHTSISTRSGTSSAARVSCRVPTTSTASITSGTNATNTVAVWYAGTMAETTALCNQIGINSNVGTAGVVWNSAGASTTATFSALTGQWSFSRIVTFLGGSASSICTPTGMTQIATLGTVAANDSGSNQLGWPSTNCTVSSENWITGVVEVQGGQYSGSPPQTAIVPVDYYIDMQGNPTLADNTTEVCTAGVCTPLTNGTHSTQTVTWAASNSGTLSGFLVSRQNYCPRNYDYYVRGDQVYPRTRPWRSMRIDHGDAAGTGGVTTYAALTTTNIPRVSITGCFYVGAQACVSNAGLVDIVRTNGAATGNGVAFQFECGQGTNPAQPAFNLESILTGASVHSAYVKVKPSSQYRFAMFVDQTTGTIRGIVWDPATLTIAGEMSLNQPGITPDPISRIDFGNAETYTNALCTGCNGNTYSYLEDIAIDMTGATYYFGPGWNEPTLFAIQAAPAAMVQRHK